ncbi:MAG TPA: uL15m family ribosomal protein [Candidatus Paceibacterota bacterium]|nr:uL15m family ribosomal protein [Candidatus Paceibacterota bacterium]HOK97441.1 uL15m family ribosomal protein [Candidatus Paceibacterota bacterium]
MQIHQLKKTYKTQKKKRIGRGGKRGNYSGRGMKGQKSRAGHKIKPQIRETILKFPKKRGVKFQKIVKKPVTVLLSDIQGKIQGDAVINPKRLKKSGLVEIPKGERRQIKILGSNELKYKYKIENCLVSQKAKESILKAGGEIKNKK